MNNDQDISIVVAAALRYALGRRSYIVSTIQNFILRHKDNNLVKRDKHLYITDIKKFLEGPTAEFMDQYTLDSWKTFLQELEK